MEFDELEKVWDTQNNQPIYVMREESLQRRIMQRKHQAARITNASELISILANAVAGMIILIALVMKTSGNVYLYIVGCWMLITALCVFVARWFRIRENNSFERSMRGDLEHALSAATFQVRLSTAMRWNVIPVGLLMIAGIWQGGKPLWFAAGVFLLLAVANIAAGWEHNYYKRKRLELQVLYEKLVREDPKDYSDNK